MWTLFPVTLALIIHTATSRTEPLDFAKSAHHTDFLIPSRSMSRLKDLTGFKLFPQRYQEIEFDDTDDIRYPLQALNLDKNTAFGEIDSAAFDELDDTIPEDFEEVELNRLSSYLSTLLRQPAWNTPLIIIEEPGGSDDFPEEHSMDIRPMWKRSRHSRRYPWKRQNGRSRNVYDYDSPHVCTPSREEVYQLLVALHDVRQGNKSRTVHYCNRRRPLNTVFTNIRFLGRRK